MHAMITHYGYYMLSGAAGLVIGGLLAGWLVRHALKKAYHPELTAAKSEALVIAEKLSAHQTIEADLRRQLAESLDAVRSSQTQSFHLNAAKAAIESRLDAIPALERELEHVKAMNARLQENLRKESSDLARALERGARLEKAEADGVCKEELIQQLNHQTARQQTELAQLHTIVDEERKRAAEKIALLNEARDQLKIEFQNLAQKIFEEKSEKFVEQNRTNMDRIMVPLREQLGEFKKRVEDVYDKESRDRTALHAEINHLRELNQRISKEALNLTRALKGDSKARGNWGEVILERVLEASGLQKGREYDVQVSCTDSTGKRYQPDVIVHLPEGKQVIIDAKVSLTDYEAYYSEEEAHKKEASLKAHIDSLRTHVRTLAAKRYDELKEVNSLDFVLMFVPIEAAFLAAAEKDRELFSEAFAKNIMVVSPSTLLVTLRTIQNIWRYEYQNRYALEIASKAGGLYDKFVGFVEALEEIGQQLDRAKSAYQRAHDRLVDGRGNLVRRSRELKQLGVKAGKELSREMIALAEGSDDEPEDDDNGSNGKN
jgi:DNA recombination protein RmuC